MKKHRHQKSTKRFNDRSRSQSSKPQVTKVRRHHHRSHRIQNKSRHTNVIHITAEARTKNIPSIEDDLHPVSKKSSMIRTKDATITNHLHQTSLIQQSQYSWYNDNSEGKLTEKNDRVYENIKHRSKISSAVNLRSTVSNSALFNHDKKKNGWPDWTTFENEHHQDNKKKKNTKCLRTCIIASIVAALLLAIVITVILVVLLNKSKATTISRTAVLRWNSSGLTVAGVTNQSGTAANQLNTPFGVTLDYMNSLYIADVLNNRVQKYQLNALSGTTVAGLANGTRCSLSICLYIPTDVAVDNYGNIYITDTANMRVQFWANGSLSGVTIAGNSSSANPNDQLNNPYGITRNPNSGILYVADTSNNRVMYYRSGSMSGTLVAGTGVSGPNNTQLSSPYGIFFDLPTNSLLIANTGMNNVVRWVIGASNWTLIAGNSNGLAGSSSTQLNTPVGVIADPMGNVYVADEGNNRVQFFPVGQSTGITIAGVNKTTGANASLFSSPLFVALDSQLNLYVSDAYNHRIQKFQRY